MFVAYYPFAEQPDSRSDSQFLRAILLAIIAAGLLVAFVGIVERATWNGKMLWFFVPYDWGQAMFEPLPRARGPFVNPDHFAGYLAMVFPLTLACALFPNLLTPQRAPLPFRIACAVAAFVILIAVLLSLSRGGWLGLAVGSAIMLLLATPRGIRIARKTAHEKDPEPNPERQLLAFARSSRFRLALAGGAMVLAVALLFVGPDARFDAALRVHDSVSADYTILDRLSAWKSGLAMFRDFPLVGAGLGASPEILPRYQLPPWTELYFNHAHNDYLELLAETGIVGTALFAWFAYLLIDRLRRGARWLTPEVTPAFAGVVGGIAAMCMIDLFDFDLRIPATALLFSVLLGLAIRIGKTPASGKRENRSAVARLRPRRVRRISRGGSSNRRRDESGQYCLSLQSDSAAESRRGARAVEHLPRQSLLPLVADRPRGRRDDRVIAPSRTSAGRSGPIRSIQLPAIDTRERSWSRENTTTHSSSSGSRYKTHRRSEPIPISTRAFSSGCPCGKEGNRSRIGRGG